MQANALHKYPTCISKKLADLSGKNADASGRLPAETSDSYRAGDMDV